MKCSNYSFDDKSLVLSFGYRNANERETETILFDWKLDILRSKSPVLYVGYRNPNER